LSYIPNILIVDDESIQSSALKILLKKNGYEVFTAVSACETLEIIRTNKTDIVLLDIHPGDENGMELLKLIKSKERVDNPFVILISGIDYNNHFVEKAVKDGADGFIQKPFVDELLLAKIKVLTRVKKQEDELLKIQQRLETIIEASVDGLLVVNKSGNIIFANKAAEKVYGYPKDELVGKNVSIPVIADTSTEALIKKRSGHDAFIELRFTKINWDNSEMFLATVRDITEMRKIRQKLIDKEKFYRKLTEKNLDGILMLDQNGEIIFSAADSCRYFDIDGKNICGSNMIEFINPNFHEDFKNVFGTVKKVPGTIRKFTWKYMTQRYKEVWFEGYIQNLFHDPVFNSILINFRNVTELTLSKEELRKKASETQLIYNAGKILNQTLDLNTIFEKFFEIVSGIMDVNDMVISSYESETESISFECVWDNRVKDDVSFYPKIKVSKDGNGLQGKVILGKKAMLLNDYMSEVKKSKTIFISGKGFVDPETVSIESYGAKSAILCPLYSADRITGVLQLFSYKYNSYTQTDLRILQALSNHLAVVMSNAKLYDNIQKELAERKRIENELRVSEERFNAFMKYLPAKAWITDKDHRVLYDNRETLIVKDKKVNKLTGKKISNLIEKKLTEEYIANSNIVLNTNKTIEVIEQAYRDDGTLGNFLVYKFPLNSPDNCEKYVGGIAVDITDMLNQKEELKAALQEIESAEHRFKEFMKYVPSITWITDKYHNILYSNKIEYKLKTKHTDNIIGKNIKELFDKEVYQNYIKSSEQVLKSGIGQQIIEKANRRDGSVGSFMVYKFRLNSPGGEPLLGAIAFDITDRLELEETLKSNIREKETVLKEIHHRVKNNLQIISSLLNLQESSTDGERNIEFLRVAQNRIRSMALIHEQLYTSDNLSNIDFEKYLSKLAAHLFSVYKTDNKMIDYLVHSDKIALDLETAIPVGLITNELVSNALKYAYKDKNIGLIEIKLEYSGESLYTLKVKDDGIGLPKDFDIHNLNSLGLSLVDMLVTQIEGKLEIHNKQGTEFVIHFSKPFYKPRLAN